MLNRSKQAALAVLAAAALCAGPAHAGKKAEVAPPRLAESTKFAKAEDGRTKVLVLPPEFKEFQLGASGVTTHEIPEWSLAAEANGAAVLADFAKNSKRFSPVAMPELSAEEKELVAEHLALADSVTFVAYQNRQFGGDPWKHKVKDFDYTLGPKLAFLRERTGADLALFSMGVDTVSTGGRVGMALLFAAAGVGIPMGQTYFMMGVIELETGNVIWANQKMGGPGFRQRLDVYNYYDSLVCQYPYGSVMGDAPQDCGRKWEEKEPGVYTILKVAGPSGPPSREARVRARKAAEAEAAKAEAEAKAAAPTEGEAEQ